MDNTLDMNVNNGMVLSSSVCFIIMMVMIIVSVMVSFAKVLFIEMWEWQDGRSHVVLLIPMF